MNDFDPNNTKKKVEAQLASNPTDLENIDRCRDIFLEDIFDFTDFYSEDCSQSRTSSESMQMLSKITELWTMAANFEANLRQFKKAQDIYQKAFADPVVNQSKDIYLNYYRFSLSREKLGNANKALISGLVNENLIHKSDYQILWQELLSLSKKITSNNNLTYQQLFKDLTEADGSLRGKLPPPPSDSSVTQAQLTNQENIVADFAESKETEKEKEAIEAPKTNSGALTDLNEIRGFDIINTIILFNNRPPMLFAPPYKEPMASGMSSLNNAELQLLEQYLQIPAQEINNSINNSNNIINSSGVLASKAAFIVQTLEAMYYAQALKERHFDAWISELQAMHNKQIQDLRAKFEHVKQFIPMQIPALQIEQQQLAARQRMQKQLLTAIINKTMYSILLEQEKILLQLFFPDEHIMRVVAHIDQLMKLADSAGQRVDAAIPMEDTVVASLLQQRKLICALIAMRISPENQMKLTNYQQHHQQQHHQQQHHQQHQQAQHLQPLQQPMFESVQQTPNILQSGNSTPTMPQRKRRRSVNLPANSAAESSETSAVFPVVAEHAESVVDAGLSEEFPVYGQVSLGKAYADYNFEATTDQLAPDTAMPSELMHFQQNQDFPVAAEQDSSVFFSGDIPVDFQELNASNYQTEIYENTAATQDHNNMDFNHDNNPAISDTMHSWHTH